MRHEQHNWPTNTTNHTPNHRLLELPAWAASREAVVRAVVQALPALDTAAASAAQSREGAAGAALQHASAGKALLGCLLALRDVVLQASGSSAAAAADLLHATLAQRLVMSA